MEDVAYGIATCPEDVARQQAGLTTGAQGGTMLPGRSANKTSFTPGTVGASPGETAAR